MGTDYTPLTDIALLLRAANYAAARTQLGLAEAFKAGVKGSNIASSGTAADIGASTGQALDITGTTTITAFPTAAAGIVRLVRFTGALILTHNATSLQLPGAANITTAAGDVGQFESLGSGNWKCAIFQPVSGKAVIPPAFADTIGFASSAQGVLAASALQPGAVLPTWTYAAGGGVPATGKLTTDNTDIASTSVIKLSKTIAGGISDGLLGNLVANMVVLFVDSSGKTSVFSIASVADAGSGNVQLNVSVNSTSGTTWAGAYSVSFCTFSLRSVDVGLGNVANAEQVKVIDIGTTVLAPNGDGALITNVVHTTDIGTTVLAPNGSAALLTDVPFPATTTGFVAPSSAGNKTTVLTDYAAVNFATIDPTNIGLNGLSTQVAELTDQVQAMLTAFRASTIPAS